ncbi:hypothetical protein L249_7473 [Ophiocordyceps polyrhachis-furcata BCC 54312]|uniref:Signal recognition particle subunit SRP14 n=1 Tax=Ophiocordyceps polyrhachis-furcata BCC 54312 TaxID=1330021 RepID=A0A367LB22_9HYPO|nr:hypothetical protein L249_7473 [Ophiocordyceps polyrhachis-furcata BCC 54312]
MGESQHLDHDEFFIRLGELFNYRKGSDHGAIYLTQKRLTYGSEDGASPRATDDVSEDVKQMPVIVRATNGKSKKDISKKVKLSTIVLPQDLDSFYLRYAEVCKAGMTALKPRDRSKKKAKARKKKAAS